MIKYTQVLVITQDDPFLKKAREKLTEDGWIVAESTVDVAFQKTVYYEHYDDVYFVEKTNEWS